MMTTPSRLFTVVCCVLALSSCSLIVGSQVTCSKDADCADGASCRDGACVAGVVKAASTLVLQVEGSPTVGVALRLTVKATDSAQNVFDAYAGTVTLTSTDTAATLPAAHTYGSADHGSFVFSNIVFHTVGPASITASDGSGLSAKVDIVVRSGSEATLAIRGTPSTVTAGTKVTGTLEARDAFGNRATGYAGTVRWTSNDPLAVLPADLVFTASDAGLKTFQIELRTAGVHSTTATDTANATISAQASVTVLAGPTTSLVVSGIPSAVTVGTKVTGTLEARDAFGNRATGYAGTVRWWSNDTLAILPADVVFKASDAGLKTVQIELRTPGTHSITATDIANTAIKAQMAVTVVAGSIASLVMSGIPSTVTAGTKATGTLEARDGFGNRATNYAGTVRWAAPSDPLAVLPADVVFTASDAGLKTSQIELRTAGTHSITATDTANASVKAQTAVTVLADLTASLVVSGIPSPLDAGTPASVTVKAMDRFSNPSTYLGTVHFTSTDNRAALPADTTFVSGDQGTRTFVNGVVLKRPGTWKVTVTDVSNSSIFGFQDGIQVQVAPAAQLVFIQSPVGTLLVNSAITPAVKVVVWDGQGNTVAEDGRTITLALGQASGAHLTGTLSASTVAGVATFSDIAVDKAGNRYTLSASSTGLPTAQSNAFDIADPCAENPCTPNAPTCSADLVTLTRYMSTCTAVDTTHRTCKNDVVLSTTDCLAIGAACVNGQCTSLAAPTSQDLLITEVMNNPTCLEPCKWFEVKNLSTKWIDLRGTTIEIGGSPSFTVPSTSEAVLAPSSYFVFGASKDTATNGGAKVDFAWPGGFTLGSTGHLLISSGATSLEELTWDKTFPNTNGSAMNLSSRVLAKGANAHWWSWCAATDAYGTGTEKGSPGAANATCVATLEGCNVRPVAASLIQGGTLAARGLFTGQGLTLVNLDGNDLYPFVVGEVGVGSGNDASAFTWNPAAFDASWSPASSSDKLYDAMTASVLFQNEGTYSLGYRFALIDPVTGQQGPWTYCGASGIVSDPSAGSWAGITVTLPP